jgi:hypothetical protein
MQFGQLKYGKYRDSYGESNTIYYCHGPGRMHPIFAIPMANFEVEILKEALHRWPASFMNEVFL